MYLTKEQEEQALKEYFEYEGNQSTLQKIGNVIQHRVLLFRRRNVDWVSRLMPLAFTAFFCFVSYAIFKSLLDGLIDEDEREFCDEVFKNFKFGVYAKGTED